MEGRLKQKLIMVFDYVMQASATEMDAKLLQLFTTEAAQKPFLEVGRNSCVSKRKLDEVARILIIAVDEARMLFPSDPNGKSIGWFRCFRRALQEANKDLRMKYGINWGVFGIVVDTDAKILSSVPLAKWDPSQREGQLGLLPPFLLTETVNVSITKAKTTTFTNGRSFTRMKYLQSWQSGILGRIHI